MVAMSGGIDSTVVALLLHEQGYEVIGMTMKTWDYVDSGLDSKETGCCSLDSINDARMVAVELGFPHYIVDIREEFEKKVIVNFVDEYMSGRTPNPCILCNTHIKWDALLKKADALDCEFIATGHYARIGELDGRKYIRKAVDLHKDQSYVLWGLEQEKVKRSLFPLGNFTKTEVRRMAYERGFTELSKKGESYEICFVPDDDYRGFLERKNPELTEKLHGGNFVNTKGEILGQHRGYPFYTIGQRKGLRVALGYPVYVKEIHPETNTVVLGTVEELFQNSMRVSGINSMKYARIPDGIEAVTKIRYGSNGTLSTLKRDGKDIIVDFHANVKGVAPGQSAVFYEGEDVIGGGIIRR